MNIGIDISQIAYAGSGVARYTEKLVDALLDNKTEHSYVFFFSSLRSNPPEALVKKIANNKHTLKRFYFPPFLLDVIWNRFHILPIELFIGDIDVFLSSDWTQPPTRKAKKVTVVHDMIPYLFPDTLTSALTISLSKINVSPNIVATQKRRLKWVEKEVDHIVADSQSTKTDIIRLIHIPEEKISVVYPYVKVSRPSNEMIEKIRKKYTLPLSYILTVGKLEPRKNIANLTKAFRQLDMADTQLVIVGAKGWDSKETLSEAIKNKTNINFIGFVPEDDLYALYAGADFFIYPSLYEGFGYPIVEAMALGCPVGTSNVSSMKEIAQDSAILFNPEDIHSISNTIKKLHDDKNLRKDLAKKGLQKSEIFTQQEFLENLLYTITYAHSH